MSSVTPIIVHYGTVDLLTATVARLHEFRPLVIDNSPELLTVQVRQKIEKSARYLPQRDNIGFGAAANLGAKLATGEWLLILNPDVSISPQQIDQFAREAEKRGYTATCPASEDSRYDHPLPSFWWFLSEYTPFKRVSFFHRLARQHPKTLWGGCLLIRRTVYEKLGGFDKDFFLWFEDSDLTRRLINSGEKIGYIDDLAIEHIGGASFGSLQSLKKRQIFFASALTYARKHLSILSILLVRLLQYRYTRHRSL